MGNISIFQMRKLPVLFLILVFTSRDVIINNDDSPTISSSAVMAFPISPLSSSPLSTTKIRFSPEENLIDTMPGKQNLEVNEHERHQQQHRRMFLGRVVLIATSAVGPTLPLLAPPVYAAASTAEAKLGEPKPEGGMVFRKAKGGGLAQTIRVGLRFKMDELQRDLMQERWDLLQPYPAQLRSYVYVFTTYTDAAFPTDSLTDRDLRVALRYEVGRFYGSVERLKKAIAKQELEEAYAGKFLVPKYFGL